jgi:hypothetical protein
MTVQDHTDLEIQQLKESFLERELVPQFAYMSKLINQNEAPYLVGNQVCANISIINNVYVVKLR